MFMDSSARDDHHAICGTNPDPTVIMPIRGDNWLKFKNYSRQLRHPRFIYLDIETIQPQRTTHVSVTQTDLSIHVPC